MPIYPGRRPSTWRVTVYAQGKQHEWVVEGPKRDAMAYEARQRLELRAKPTTAAARAVPKFCAFVAEVYEPHAKRHLGRTTWRTSRKYELAELVRVLGDERLDSPWLDAIERYTSSRLARGIAASTINQELGTLRTVLNFARSQGHPVPELPKPFPYLPERGKRKTRAWTNDEVRRLFAALEERWRALVPIFVFLLNTGCRKGEAIAAEWTWIDWDRAMLTIPVTPYWQPKDKDERMVPLSDALMETLRRLPRCGRTIFVTRWGSPYAQFPSRLAAEAIEAAGVKGTIHTTRHTFASHFLRARPDLRLLAEVLGHSTTAVTERYSHMLPGHLETARNAVNLLPAGKLWRETLATRASSRKH